MKKYLLLPILLFITTLIYSQVPEDVIRYSFFPQNGTARSLAIGGAMGSLGGDITATFVNPAGLAFYKTGDFILTPAYKFGKVKADYYGRTEKEKSNKFTWGATGFVIGMGGNKGSSVHSSAFSLAV